MNNNDKGLITELEVKKNLIEQGYTVSEPINQDSSYDLIIDTGEELKKIQCKSASHKNGKILIRIASVTNNTSQTKRKYYTEDEVDYFATYSKKTEKTYLIPFEDTGKTKIALRYEEADIEHPNVNKAKDYEMRD